jgi:hypothetical protein
MEALFKELGIGPREGSQGGSGGDPEQQRQFAAAWEAMLVEGMNGMTNTSAEDTPSPAPKGDDFQSKIHSTMNKLRESESGLQASDSTTSGGDAFESLLSQLGGLGGDAQDEENLQGMLETMMGQLMSKEVLHEPLKELYEKASIYDFCHSNLTRNTVLVPRLSRQEQERDIARGQETFRGADIVHQTIVRRIRGRDISRRRRNVPRKDRRAHDRGMRSPPFLTRGVVTESL